MNQLAVTTLASSLVALVALAGCARAPEKSAGLTSPDQLGDGITGSAGDDAGGGGPDCSDEGRADRMAYEFDLFQQMRTNACFPGNWTDDMCIGIDYQWLQVKDDNATCNAQAAGESLCEYYCSLLPRYNGYITDYCSPPHDVEGEWPTGNLDPCSAADACAYAQHSIDYFNSRVSTECN
jgi:hypothetical protein